MAEPALGKVYLVNRWVLPLLVFHAILKGDSRSLNEYLRQTSQVTERAFWLKPGSSFGEAPFWILKDLLSASELQYLELQLERQGMDGNGNKWVFSHPFPSYGSFSSSEGGEKGSVFSRFLCSQTLCLVLKGVPLVFLPALLEPYGWQEKSFKRLRWEASWLEEKVNGRSSRTGRALRGFSRLLRTRSRHKCFHPLASERIVDLGSSVFACERVASDGSEALLAITNLRNKTVTVSLKDTVVSQDSFGPWKDTIRGRSVNGSSWKLSLQPYQTLWLMAPASAKSTKAKVEVRAGT